MIKTVKFTIEVDKKVKARKISVDGENITLRNGHGEIDLNTKEPHFLVWHFSGDPKASLKIIGKMKKNDGTSKEVIKVKDKIPEGETVGAGIQKFKL